MERLDPSQIASSRADGFSWPTVIPLSELQVDHFIISDNLCADSTVGPFATSGGMRASSSVLSLLERYIKCPFRMAGADRVEDPKSPMDTFVQQQQKSLLL